MIDYSLSEISAICTKAARGVNYSWGMAQEAAFAAKWLHQHGISGADILCDMLTAFDAEPATPFHFNEGNLLISAGPICPISLGCFVSDDTSNLAKLLNADLANVLEPVLLIPFLAQCLGENDWLELRHGQFAYQFSSIYLVNHPANVHTSSIVPIQSSTNLLQAPCCYQSKHWEQLTQLAARILVPESEQSRERGAG